MYFDSHGNFVRTDMWAEGKWLDLWSVPHFLSGIALAFTIYLFKFDTDAAFIIAFLLLVAYEMFEVIAKIEETPTNRIMDVVVGMVSFTPTFLLAPRLSETEFILVFGAVLTLDAVLSTIGWSASQKAASLEKKLRAELASQKEKFKARREHRIARRLKRHGKRKFWQRK